MKGQRFFVLFTVLHFFCCTEGKNEDEVMENQNLIEGDIIRVPEAGDRNAVVDDKRKWPDARIPYTIDPKLSKYEPLIRKAMDHYEKKTCIRFVPRSDEKQYVKVLRGNGCYSHVGRTSGAQPLSLGPKCLKFGTVVHELGHAVGFFHEHSRYDRDNYLDIHYQNVQPGMVYQFVKMNPKQHQLLTNFDYDSIMLYGETIFSKSGDLKTMTAKDGRSLKNVADKPGLSDSDVTRVSKLYNC